MLPLERVSPFLFGALRGPLSCIRWAVQIHTDRMTPPKKRICKVQEPSTGGRLGGRGTGPRNHRPAKKKNPSNFGKAIMNAKAKNRRNKHGDVRVHLRGCGGVGCGSFFPPLRILLSRK